MRNFIFSVTVITLVGMLSVFSCKQEPGQGDFAAGEPSGQLYMDVHRNIDGLTAEAVAGAHQKDLEVQGKYGVDYKRYWYDAETGTVFCLVQAPSKEAAATVHKEAHGLVADEIIEVDEGM